MEKKKKKWKHFLDLLKVNFISIFLIDKRSKEKRYIEQQGQNDSQSNFLQGIKVKVYQTY